jgi:diaminohydroxyphosphoribosylaminopyrimidine deaminase/5-amino-6-(5-phosphoribosylamino)uracil reductase
VREGDAPTLYVHAPDTRIPRECDAQMAAAPVHGGRFDLAAVLRLLGDRKINEVQLEAGATLAGAFLAAGLVDELLLYVAPVLLGAAARPLFDGFDVQQMADRQNMRLIDSRQTGDDLRLLLRPAT